MDTSRRAVLVGLRFGLGVSWSTNRISTIGIIAVPVVQALVPAALAIVVRGLVNAVLANDGDEAQRFVIFSLLLGVTLALTATVQLFLTQRHLEELEHHLGVAILLHASDLPFEYFERRDFQDTIALARRNPGMHTHSMLVRGIRSMAASVTVITLLAVLAGIEPRALLYLLPVAPPYMLYRWWLSKRRFDVTVSQIRSRRWVDWLSAQLMTDDSIPEARVLQIGPVFVEQADERLGTMRRENLNLFWKEFTGSSIFNTIAVFALHLALFQAVNRTIDGSLTVGDIAVFSAAATGIRTALDQVIAGLSQMRWHVKHVNQLQNFLELKPEDLPVAPPRPIHASDDALLSLSGVKFTYPNASTPTLDGVDLTIRPGETLALVGRNGSGKSTLVKLIAGLYQPDAGEIVVAGGTTSDTTHLRTHLSVVFQHFGKYHATVGENIAMGDWERLAEDPGAVRALAERVGIEDMIEQLPEGYNTLLGRAFGEVNLSGGQWQTLAIARAFAREASIMILDEPTANLDAEVEYAVFRHFRELTAGRSTLLVSHRFTTLALADRIAVLDEGRIAEVGSHEELVELDGIYARLHRLHRRASDPHDLSADGT